jgi:monothiol glutaredoxin
MKGTPETPQCGFSRTSIQILGMQGVDPAKFTAFNVLEDNELRSGMHTESQHSKPPRRPQGVVWCGTSVVCVLTVLPCAGIKEYSDWPTIPQLYINKEFIGGCDILINMHKDGSLAELLSEKKLVLEEDERVDGGHPTPS